MKINEATQQLDQRAKILYQEFLNNQKKGETKEYTREENSK